MKGKEAVCGYLTGGVCLLSFAGLAAVTKLWFPDVYLLEWTCRHSYIYIWAWVFYLTAIRKEVIAVALSSGNLFGVIVGQIYGSYLFDIDMAKLEAGVNIGRGYPQNYSFGIYICSLLAAFILGVLIQFNFFRGWQQRVRKDEEEKKRIAWAHVIGILCLVAFQFLWAFTNTYSPDMEHFVGGWTAHYHYLYCWALIYYFTGKGKSILSVSLTVGNMIGVFLGDVLGSLFRQLSIENIPPYNTGDAKALMFYANHNGLAIWVACVIFFMILGTYIQKKGLRLKCPEWLKWGLIRVKEWWLRIYNA